MRVCSGRKLKGACGSPNRGFSTPRSPGETEDLVLSEERISLCLLLFAITYWAFGMHLLRYTRSSMRGRIEMESRGPLINTIEFAAIAIVLFGTFFWLYLLHKWYVAIVLFVLLQIIGSIVSLVPLFLLMRFRGRELHWIGTSNPIFFGWLLADALVLVAWLFYSTLRG